MDSPLPIFGDPMIDRLIADFFTGNEAGQAYANLCQRQGKPWVIDHITLRCMDIERRAAFFLEKGYLYQGELVEYPDQGWWARIYRKDGFPTLFIDQAYQDARGQTSIIPQWVAQFGEEALHHVAVLVPDIEATMDAMKQIGVEFSGEIVGKSHTRLRQIFSAAEIRNGSPFSVLELTERNGYSGFYPEQANRLMASSVKTKSTPPHP
jgi:catechol 2,3-dioxygenase-like lactoylglutathione lyase family enzyme